MQSHTPCKKFWIFNEKAIIRESTVLSTNYGFYTEMNGRQITEPQNQINLLKIQHLNNIALCQEMSQMVAAHEQTGDG